MAVIVFFSAKGAPGATTVAMLTSALWPRPALLVDADPAGGDIGVRIQAADGRQLDLERGMLSVLPLARRAVSPDALLLHAQQTLGGGQVLVGLSGPEQVRAAGPLWGTLGEAFVKFTDADVIIDAGRLDSTSPLLPMIAYADLAVCVARVTATGVIAARSRLHGLAAELTGPSRLGPRLGVVLRTPKGTRDTASAVEALRADVPNLDYFGTLVDDPQGAAVFEGDLISRPERTLLVRAGHEMVAGLWSVTAPEQTLPEPPVVDQARHAQADERPPQESPSGAANGIRSQGEPSGPTGEAPLEDDGDGHPMGGLRLPTDGGRRAARRGRRA